MQRLWIALIVATPLGWWGSAASAQPIEEGVALYEDAEFGEALQAFDRALSEAELTREQLVRLFYHRALVHHALGDEPQLEIELLRLASLEPSYQLPPQTPPSVVRVFERLPQRPDEPIGVEVEGASADGQVVIDARVVRDIAALAQRLELGAREGGGPWVRGTGSVVLRGAEESRVEYFARVLGPGNAILAAEGSMDEPLPLVRAVASADPAEAPVAVNAEQGGGGPGWIWGGVVGGALLVGAAVAAFLLIPSDGSAQVGPPQVDFGGM